MKKFKESHHDAQSMDIQDFKEKLAKKDIEAWYEVKHAIVEEKKKIIRNTLDSKSPLFHPKMQDKKDSFSEG